MKSYLKKNNMSITTLSNNTGIPYSTLNDIVNGKTDINNVKFDYIKRLSKELNITLDEFNSLFCTETITNPNWKLITKNKKYYLKNKYTDTPEYLCKVNNLNTFYIAEIAEFHYRQLEQMEIMKQWKSE